MDQQHYPNNQNTIKTKEIKLSLMNYDAELAINFQKDCENLLISFENISQQHNFKEFGNVWREMNFTGIFEGQQYLSMLEIYLENCYLIAKKFLFSPKKIIRLGAIYLLYSLFYKQPIKKWIKIRLTDVEFIRIQEILDEFKLDTLELQYIYNKLCLDNAFLYCAKDLQLSPHLQRFNLKDYPIFTNGQNHLVFKKYQQLESDIDELKQIDQNYQELLKKYQSNHEINTTNETTIYQKIDEINDEIFNEDQEIHDATKDIPLKRKAFENQFAQYRATKTVITASDLQLHIDNRK